MLPGTPPPSAPTITSYALKLGDAMNAELQRRLTERQKMWRDFWFNPIAANDPQSLATAYEAVYPGIMAHYFGRAVADSASLQQVATNEGVTLDALVTINGVDYSKYLAIPPAYTVSTDGKTITLVSGWTRTNTAGRVTLSGPNGATITQ